MARDPASVGDAVNISLGEPAGPTVGVPPGGVGVGAEIGVGGRGPTRRKTQD